MYKNEITLDYMLKILNENERKVTRRVYRPRPLTIEERISNAKYEEEYWYNELKRENSLNPIFSELSLNDLLLINS